MKSLLVAMLVMTGAMAMADEAAAPAAAAPAATAPAKAKKTNSCKGKKGAELKACKAANKGH